MSAQYRLNYHAFNSNEILHMNAEAIQYGEPQDNPERQRYFYAVTDDGRRVCFIKRSKPDSVTSGLQNSAERQGGSVHSPYIAAQYNAGMMRVQSMEWRNSEEESWEPLAGSFLLCEYLPSNLENFWSNQPKTLNEEMLNLYRRQILLKVIEGIGHLHQEKIVHRDIKPANIMINSADLCPDAWYSEELDVKLTDLDSAHNVRQQGAGFYTYTLPYQPAWRCCPNAWLDIYSLCMVALWLYIPRDKRPSALDRLNASPHETEDRIYNTLSAVKNFLPEKFLLCIVPAFLRATQGISKTDADWDTVNRELAELSKKLQNFFSGASSCRLPELLEPAKEQIRWSAIIQIDRSYWPVLGQGQEYHTLPLTENLLLERRGIRNPIREMNGSEYDAALSAAPEICVTCNGKNALEATVYGKESKDASRPFIPRQLAAEKNIRPGREVVLYDGAPVWSWESNAALFRRIQIHAVHLGLGVNQPDSPLHGFHKNRTDGAKRGQIGPINIVLIMDTHPVQDMGSVSCRLLHQVVQCISGVKTKCQPRYYGLAVIRKAGEKPLYRSFCGGQTHISAKILAQNFSSTTNRDVQLKSEMVWKKTANGRCAFDPQRPTIVIGFWDRPDKRNAEEMQDAGSAIWRLTGSELRAADYFQLLIHTEGNPDVFSSWGKRLELVLPQFSAAVKPGGAYIVTPVANIVETEERAANPAGYEPLWLRAFCDYCGDV